MPSGTIAEDDTATGTILIEIADIDEGIAVDWNADFEAVDGTLQLSGEYEGLLEEVTVEMETGTLVFDVAYSGGFEMTQTRVP